MFYLFCFIVSLILLLYVLGYGKNLDNNLIFLMIVLAVGNGGKFNTYLRKPLNEYASKNSTETMSGTYSYKDNVFKYEIEPFYAFRGRRGGYVIKIKDVTDLFDKKKNEE